MYCGDGQGASDSSTMHVTGSPSVSCSIQFTFQFGLKREHIQLSRSNFSLEELKELAATTVIKQFPQAQVYGNLSQKINLFLHNDQFDNILQLINNQSSNEVQDRSIIEIVLSADFNEASRKIQPHVLNVHSYRSPAFCDHCGEMLFGIVRQGLRCEGCGQNYHKRCAYKIPNNCTMERKRKASCSTPGPSGHSSNGSLGPVDSISSSGPILPSPVGKKPSRGPGRPLWAEGFTNIRVPHTFQVHSYTRPTVCHYCRRLLRGIFKQGMQCKDCKFSCHKRCMVEIPDNCPGEINDSKTSEADGEDLEMESDDSNETEAVFDYTKPYSPSPQQQVRGGAVLSSSSSMLGPDSSHFPPPPSPAVPNGKGNGLLQVPSHEFEDPDMDIDPPRHAVSTSGVGASELVPPHHHHHHHQSSSAASGAATSAAAAAGGGGGGQFEAPNIPLMRIAESFRNTKQHASSTILREGWLLHFTSNDALSRRHYWRLDSKSITLYRSNHGTNYHREVPLCDVLNIEVVQRMEEGKSVYATFLKINTSNADIFVCAEKEAKPGTLSQWHDAIKRALKPVDTIEQRPTSTTGGLKRKVSVMISFHHEKEDEKASDISEIYQVFPDEVLGSGQFGIVYGGKHRKRGFDVAVKVVEKQRFQHKEESQLRHEVQILESLDNPGIVRLYNMFETPEQIFVVMEKLRGDMLEMILSSEKGRLPERMTKFLITQILMALRYLHKQNVVHCDLKPENVLLSTPDAFPQLKLCDFGFARIIGQKSFRRSVVGTPAYLAPEVLRKECYNRSLDMWSVGVIIYVSLSGTFPFNEDEDINQQIQNAAFMYPPNPWNGISAEAIDLIGTLLQVKKRKRPSVDKALCHGWLHDFTCWKDLRTLEESLGKRYLTYESDDAHWQNYAIKQQQHDNKSSR